MLKADIDAWFRRIRTRFAAEMQCGKGCTACCHGLFDISLADAADVARAYLGLPREVQQRVLARASEIHRVILESAAGLEKPVVLNEDDSRIDLIVGAANDAACPCLGDNGECLIYENRPLACRLEGAPMVDVRDGLFADWCELNFKRGVFEQAKPELRLDYNLIDETQERSSAAIADRAGFSDARAVTFIPSVIMEWAEYWKPLSR